MQHSTHSGAPALPIPTRQQIHQLKAAILRTERRYPKRALRLQKQLTEALRVAIAEAN